MFLKDKNLILLKNVHAAIPINIGETSIPLFPNIKPEQMANISPTIGYILKPNLYKHNMDAGIKTDMATPINLNPYSRPGTATEMAPSTSLNP